MDRLKKYTSGWLPADYILAALLISFPVYNRLMPVLMILLGITLQVHRKSWRDILAALKPGQPHVWLLLFFLAHIIGLAYTENFDFAYNDIGMKISPLRTRPLYCSSSGAAQRYRLPFST